MPLYRLIVLFALIAGCAGAPPPGEAATSADALVRALARSGWTLRPERLLRLEGMASSGAAYTAEQVPPARTLFVFDATADGEPLPAEVVDSDVAQLQRRFAGRGAVVYRTSRLLVVTFGRDRNALDDRLAQWLGPPVSSGSDGERSKT